MSRVTAVDSAAKTITIKFGGGPLDTYKTQVTSATYGDFGTKSKDLVVQAVLSDFTPKSGSIYGGTLITITGSVFSNDGLDNNVKIGKTDCIVITSSTNQITCRTEPRKAESANNPSETFVVFLKATEEAKCEASNNCEFTWLDATLPTVTG